MKRIASIVMITVTAFFMVGCDSLEELEKELPVIELIGDSVMEVELYSEFVDPGADILGEFDLEVIVESNVDTNTLGEYTITYTITYLDIEYVVSRTVSVVEELSGDTPSLGFIGETVLEIEQYSVFEDPGVEIIGDFDIEIDVVSDIDTSVLGTYTIVYTITYLEVEYSLTRTVEVIMEIVEDVPSIELVGKAVIDVEVYTSFIDLGAKVVGDFDLDITVDSNVDVYTIGQYTITYSITYMEIDYTVTRTVNVIEPLIVELPSIVLVGESSIEIEKYSVFIDLGAIVIGDFDLDITVESDVDVSTLGVYTITYSITYLEIEYSVTRSVEIVELKPKVSASFVLVDVTQTGFVATIDTVDSENVDNLYIEFYKGDELISSVDYDGEFITLVYTDLEPDTSYGVYVVAEYIGSYQTITTTSGISTITLALGELSVVIDSYTVGVYSVDLDITVIDDDLLITSNRVYIYSDSEYVGYDFLYTGLNSINIDYLDPDTNYDIYVEYYYIPKGETEEVIYTSESINITTPSIPMLGVSSHNSVPDIEFIDVTFTLSNIGFNSVDLWADIYLGDTYLDYYYIGYDSYYDFYDLDASTEYTIYLYADYTYGGVDYSDVLIGTYTVTTLDAIVYNPPVIDNMVVTRTATSVTVEFDLTDTYSTMDRGLVRLFKGYYSSAEFVIVEGHNVFTFDTNIYENTLYTVKIEIDYKDDGTYSTEYEEDVYTPPVITVNSFTQNEMFYVGDHIVMELDIENDEEVNIEFVIINGVRYSVFVFPTTTDVIYIDMGVDTSVHSYIANIESIGILLGGEEDLIVVDVDTDVSVYLLGTMVPSDATVRVIDIIPEEYFVNIDNDNPSATTSIGISIYLDNKYNLPVSSITIGGVVYTGEDLTVVSATELLVSAKFSYDGNNSNDNIYFSEIIFERNGSIISDNQSDHVNIDIFEIYNRDWDSETAEVIHVSTPEDLLAMYGDPVKPQIMYVLDNDIDMTGYNFIPIGTYDDPFTGGFNGNGYTISNVTISGTYGTDHGTDYIGLFGYSKGVIFDLNLDNVTINVTTTVDNYLYIGVLAGKQEYDVYNVNVYNSTITIDGLIAGAVGGLAGQQHGDVVWSSADADITITQPVDGSTNSRLYVGGLVGSKVYEDIRSSYATGDITVTSPTLRTVFTGGLLGYIYNPLGSSSPNYVINSYATGNITVDTDYYGRTGGLIGDTYMYRYDTIIKNSFATGNVSTYAGTTGGLIGETYAEVNSSFAIGTANGTNGTISRMFGDGNDYALVNIYAYDNQIVSRDGNPIKGSDTYYIFIGVATSTQFNDANYYIDHLGWSSHFFDFSNLDIENGLMPTMK